MKTAYLASHVTLPSAPGRRSDAFEHDAMMGCLRAAFEPKGAQVDDIAWDDPAAEWSAYDAAIIGTTWDYWDRHEEFLRTLQTIAGATQLLNPIATVRWNSHKSYLRDLGAEGVSLISTLWLDDANAEAAAAFDRLGADDVVFKRQVGASADGQHRLRRGQPIPTMSEPMMAQPFLHAIQSEGEFSFIFIDGDFSHALMKRAADGDYRIQSEYGGIETAITPSTEEIAAATRALLAMPGEAPLYARVDMLRGEDGDLLLMELELIEPYLYPQQGPELGDRLYAALKRRL
jgi:hypothetical protein